MLYADWAFYSAHYKQISDQAEFERLAYLASRKLDIYTGLRAEKATGYKANALKDATCNMADYLQTTEQSGQGKGVASVSNDGYSESYQAVTPEQAEVNLKSVAFQWLSGTGLMGAL